MQDDVDYKSAVDSIADIALDFAENKLHQSIKKGSDTATIFFLKTKGKKRGYVERPEFVDIGGPMILNIEVLDKGGAESLRKAINEVEQDI
jgi:hypothetical protein